MYIFGDVAEEIGRDDKSYAAEIFAERTVVDHHAVGDDDDVVALHGVFYGVKPVGGSAVQTERSHHALHAARAVGEGDLGQIVKQDDVVVYVASFILAKR